MVVLDFHKLHTYLLDGKFNTREKGDLLSQTVRQRKKTFLLAPPCRIPSFSGEYRSRLYFCAQSSTASFRFLFSLLTHVRQVVLQLQTRVSVVVAKLLHSGGEVLSAPMPSPFCSKYRGKVSKRSALTPTAPAYTMSISGDDGGGVVDAHAMGEEEAIGLAKGGAGGSFSSGLYYRQGGSANKTRSRDWVGDQAYDGGRSSKRTGGDTGDRSVCVNEDAGDDVIPSGWVEAPAELLRPTGPVKDGCEVSTMTVQHVQHVIALLRFVIHVISRCSLTRTNGAPWLL